MICVRLLIVLFFLFCFNAGDLLHIEDDEEQQKGKRAWKMRRSTERAPIDLTRPLPVFFFRARTLSLSLCLCRPYSQILRPFPVQSCVRYSDAGPFTHQNVTRKGSETSKNNEEKKKEDPRLVSFNSSSSFFSRFLTTQKTSLDRAVRLSLFSHLSLSLFFFLSLIKRERNGGKKGKKREERVVVQSEHGASGLTRTTDRERGRSCGMKGISGRKEEKEKERKKEEEEEKKKKRSSHWINIVGKQCGYIYIYMCVLHIECLLQVCCRRSNKILESKREGKKVKASCCCCSIG